MPAFTFEKILPPSSRGPIPPVEPAINPAIDPAIEKKQKKTHGVLVQILERFVQARGGRAQRVEESILARRERTPSEGK